MLTDLVHSNDDRHLKIQKDRLLDEFSSAVSAFQAVQKKTVDIEKSQYRAARSNNIALAKPPNSQANSNKSSFFMDTFSSSTNDAQNDEQQMQTQMQDDIDLQGLEEQERSIRELEVSIFWMDFPHSRNVAANTHTFLILCRRALSA